jgi:hypothetical protein
MSKKLTVNVLKEMVRKALVSEQSSVAVPQPRRPLQSPPAQDNNNLLANAQKMLADNEALRAEIKAEMEANPKDARILKMALQDIAQAILGNKEVIATLAKKQTGGAVVEEGFDEEGGEREELWLTIENDGEVSSPEQRQGNSLGRKYDAILNNLKKHAAKGRYDKAAAIKGWMYFVDDYARQYAEDYLELYGRSSKAWISKSDRLEIAGRLEEKERNNVTGEGEWEKPRAGDFSSDVTFEEQAGAAPALAVEKADCCTKEQAYAAPSIAAEEKALDEILKEYGSDFRGFSHDPDKKENDPRWADEKAKRIASWTAAEEERRSPQVAKNRASWAKSDAAKAGAVDPEYEKWSKNQLESVDGTVEYEHPLDRVRNQEAEFDLSNLDSDEYSDLDDDLSFADMDSSMPGMPAQGDHWSASEDPDQSPLPSLYPEDGEDTSWVNDTVPEPGQELPKQMGMGKMAALKKEEAPVVDEEFSMKAHSNDPANMAEKVMEALGWVSNDDPNKVATFEHWVRREAREASRRGGVMDPEQYVEIAEEFISDMTDANEEYSMMDTEDQEAAGMTRVEAYPFTLMDKVALGKTIVEKLS